MRDDKVGAVLVVGGGIAGIQASLDLAESGYYVYLVEALPAIGGAMTQLDKTFPTNDCAMCIVSPKLVAAGRHMNIEVLAYSEVVGVEGEPGNFKVTIRKKPRYVDLAKCTGCGECIRACVFKKGVPSEFEEGLARRKPIYILFPQAVPLKAVVDRESCLFLSKGKCTKSCMAACQAGAIDFNQQEEMVTVEVGSLILCPGFDEFDAKRLAAYGYGRLANVITSIQFERILSPSGPFQGTIVRPSDQKAIKKIAWIQCAGSRDMTKTGGNEYCSSICCMYAIKEAVIAREHQPDIETTIFYMDVRAQGKDFDAYYERAKGEHGVRFIRSMVSRVAERPKSKNLQISYVDAEQRLQEEEFDLVVLSVGITPSSGAREVAKQLGIELNAYGFCKTDEFSPLDTSRPGVYVCGTFQGPKDIPETVAQASAAVASASGFLADARGTMTRSKDYPAERNVLLEEPRIGVFVCHCGTNIGSVVNVPEVREYARNLKDVVYVDESLYACSQETQEKMKTAIKEHNLNRVVVASCSPRTHEPIFRETIRDAGLNKFLFEMANIRDQCSWVHMKQKAEATEKAKKLVRMAVANVRLNRSLSETSVPVIHRSLVIGGGVAGMTAALQLADQGFEVFLVEKESRLGGNLWNLHYTLEGKDIEAFRRDLIDKVSHNPLIHVLLNSLIVDFSGVRGNFATGVMTAPAMSYQKIEHGIAIIATGAEEEKPHDYCYGEDERILTQLELEGRIANNDLAAGIREVVMIQCVGSRNEHHPSCSRTCCATAIKNALKLKELNPSITIHILYRDIRTYGLMEPYYTQARREGILFVRYEPAESPKVTIDGQNLSVSFEDKIIKERITIAPDLLVLSSATVPRENKELSNLLKVPRTAEGFFLEAHVKLRPVDFASDGLYLAGAAHAPKLIGETISQAGAAVARACTILSKENLSVGGVVAVVTGEKCAACLTCVRVCPYNVPVINAKGEAQIDIIKCKGCGICAAECPAKAIELMHFHASQLDAKVGALINAQVG